MTDAEFRDHLIVSAIQGSAVHEGAVPEDVARRAIDIADAVMQRLSEKRTDAPQGAKPTSAGDGSSFDKLPLG
jgi:hypothetical protein